MRVIGFLVFVLGASLWCGNVFRFFPTIPFAGYLTMLVGGMMLKSGNK